MAREIRMLIVYVSDMERSLAFYSDALGFTARMESERWSELDAGALTLALHSSRGESSPPAEWGAAGQADLQVTVDDLDEIHRSLTERGVTDSQPRVLEGIGLRVLTLRDPDGLAITLLEAAH